MADGWTTNLLAGLAELLAAESVGVWRESGIYQPDETAIVIRAIPQTPDQVITLSAYHVGDEHIELADVRQGVQVRVRGTTDPRCCDNLADGVFNALHGATYLDCRGVIVVQAWRQSATSLGQDANGRWEASHNYYLDAMRPTQHRPN